MPRTRPGCGGRKKGKTMAEDELLAWVLLYSGGVALIGVYYLAVALEWCWRQVRGRRWQDGGY